MNYNIKPVVLRLFLEDGYTYDECKNFIEDGYYLVYTNEEADNAVFEYIKESLWAFNPNFLANYIDLSVNDITHLQKSCELNNHIFVKLLGDGINELVKDSINTDSRGHFLARYDGVEHEITIDLTTSSGADELTFYIYKCE